MVSRKLIKIRSAYMFVGHPLFPRKPAVISGPYLTTTRLPPSLVRLTISKYAKNQFTLITVFKRSEIKHCNCDILVGWLENSPQTFAADA